LLAANADAKFAAGQSSNAASTLNGTISLNLQNGKLVGIDMLNQLATIGNFLQGKQAAQPFTNIAKLTGDFKVVNGVAQTNNVNAAIDGGNVAAAGTVNLVSQTLDMAVTAVLSKEYSQSVGGTNIGGFLTTALANKNGELVMPVLISGTFSAPKVQPDYKKIAQMRLENAVPGIGGKGGVGGLIQTVLGGNRPQQDQQTQPGEQGQQTGQTPQQQKPGSPLQNILDALGSKQKAKQQQPPPQQPQEQPKTNEEDKLPDPTNPK
jgi:hypothetical protein